MCVDCAVKFDARISERLWLPLCIVNQNLDICRK